jgi:hypothetical protein
VCDKDSKYYGMPPSKRARGGRSEAISSNVVTAAKGRKGKGEYKRDTVREGEGVVLCQ